MTNKLNDTIAALATPPGVSGLAVIRLSGSNSIQIAEKCFSGKIMLTEAKTHTIHYGSIVKDNITIDSVTVSIFKSPNSYTGEDSVEIACHGGYMVYGTILDILINLGARLADPGEFTKRAFLNGKMDLTQVESVSDIIHSLSARASQTAARQLYGSLTSKLDEIRRKLLDISSLLELELDFSEDEILITDRQKISNSIIQTINHCKQLSQSYKASEILKSGFYVAIAGYPNSGKSTLFNALLQRQRAIVSAVPGTTRDYLEDIIYLDGMPIKIIDTAGLRPTGDLIEIEGIRFTDFVLRQSNMILILNDIALNISSSNGLKDKIIQNYPDSIVITVQNKIDMINESQVQTYIISNPACLFISAKNTTGLDQLKSQIANIAKQSTARITDTLINQRQSILLKRASTYLETALESLRNNTENELIALDIRQAVDSIAEITGVRWSEEVLNNIFSKFCIGK